jgi:hypothetical protein
VLADLILTGHATSAESASSIPTGEAIHAQVHVIMPVTTLAGGGEAGALATGGDRSRLRAPTAAGATTWTRLLTDSWSRAGDRGLPPLDRHPRRTGCPRPTLPVPGCRQPRGRDIDHTHAREHGGPTSIGNLAHLSTASC